MNNEIFINRYEQWNTSRFGTCKIFHCVTIYSVYNCVTYLFESQIFLPWIPATKSTIYIVTAVTREPAVWFKLSKFLCWYALITVCAYTDKVLS